MARTDVNTYLDRVADDRERSRRFVARVSWAIVGLLVSMPVFIWLLRIERQAGHREVAEVFELTLVGELLAFIVLVVILRTRLAAQVRLISADHDVLLEQNRQLAAQTAALELSTRRLTEAHRVARLGYWEIDSTTGDVYWSDEMYRLAGLEVGTRPVPTEQFLAAVHPDDRQRVADVSASAFAEFSQQYRIAAPGGPVRTVHATGRIVVDEQGTRKLVGTVQDITERVGLETQLRRSQKMDAMGQLAGGIAHDFNNLLTVIESYSSMLLEDPAIAGGAHEEIDEIRSAARRAATLTRQLLAFSRQQVLQPRILDLNEAIGDVEKMLRRLIGADVECYTTLADDIDPVFADPTQIEQVLMNLVLNARDAMPRGGRLTIETANVELGPSVVLRGTACSPGPYVMLAVSDTGSGIPRRIADQIFEPFFTTKPVGQGTGLGLATVQGIVEQSGGYVSVYSEPGHGTTFKVYLPRATAGSASDVSTTRRVTPPTGNETVLLVEDDAAVRGVAVAILRRAGHRVIEAGNGFEALHAIERHPSAIQLVISDVVMPVMGGGVLAEELEHRWPSLPVLLTSGYTRQAAERGAPLHAKHAFLEKPYSPDSLLRKVRDVLDG
jgi:signal transduction histidine kinase/CheY-like chemotaxis protein